MRFGCPGIKFISKDFVIPLMSPMVEPLFLLADLYGSSFIVIIAYLARFVFIAQSVMQTTLSQIPASYNEAALIMGAPGYKRWFRLNCHCFPKYI